MPMAFRITTLLLLGTGAIFVLYTAGDVAAHFILNVRTIGRVASVDAPEFGKATNGASAANKTTIEFNDDGGGKSSFEIDPASLDHYPPDIGMEVGVVYPRHKPQLAKMWVPGTYWGEKAMGFVIGLILIGSGIGSFFYSRMRNAPASNQQHVGG